MKELLRIARSKSGEESGVAFIMTLILLGVVGVLAAAYLTTSQGTTTVAFRQLDQKRAFWAAEAGIEHLKSMNFVDGDVDGDEGDKLDLFSYLYNNNKVYRIIEVRQNGEEVVNFEDEDYENDIIKNNGNEITINFDDIDRDEPVTFISEGKYNEAEERIKKELEKIVLEALDPDDTFSFYHDNYNIKEFEEGGDYDEDDIVFERDDDGNKDYYIAQNDIEDASRNDLDSADWEEYNKENIISEKENRTEQSQGPGHPQVADNYYEKFFGFTNEWPGGEDRNYENWNFNEINPDEVDYPIEGKTYLFEEYKEINGNIKDSILVFKDGMRINGFSSRDIENSTIIIEGDLEINGAPNGMVSSAFYIDGNVINNGVPRWDDVQTPEDSDWAGPKSPTTYEFYNWGIY